MAGLLGLDFGTGGVRVGVFDLDRRTMLGEKEESYSTRYPRPGWAEQDPTAWWEAAGRAARGVMHDLGYPDIRGVCAATTASTVVACTRAGQPLRPALLWMDCRAAAEAETTASCKHPVMRYSGGGDAAEWLVPKAMWLARNEPETYSRADIICECLDFVNFMLTGLWVGSRMNATCKWNYDSVQGRFHDEVFAEFGVPDLGEKLPRDIVPVGAAIGSLTRAAREHLGLRGSAVVAQGGIDAHMGVLGANTLLPGDMLSVGGTSVASLFQLAQETPVPGFWGPYPHALVEDYWLVEAGQVSAGSVLSWWVQEIFRLDKPSLETLWREAEALPIGGAGLVALDFFMGNRTPFRDPLLRGAVVGLSLAHDRAGLYRAAVESVALASANVVRHMESLGIACRRIVSSGGYAKNPLWLRATVDAIGVPVQLSSDANLTIIGAAASAAAATGLAGNLFEAAAAVAQPTTTLDPDPKAHALYTEMLAEYLEVADLLAPVARRLAERQLRRPGHVD